jgi:hypothetical protein
VRPWSIFLTFLLLLLVLRFGSMFSLTFVLLDVLMHLLQQHLFVVVNACWRPVIWI